MPFLSFWYVFNPQYLVHSVICPWDDPLLVYTGPPLSTLPSMETSSFDLQVVVCMHLCYSVCPQTRPWFVRISTSPWRTYIPNRRRMSVLLGGRGTACLESVIVLLGNWLLTHFHRETRSRLFWPPPIPAPMPFSFILKMVYSSSQHSRRRMKTKCLPWLALAKA